MSQYYFKRKKVVPLTAMHHLKQILTTVPLLKKASPESEIKMQSLASLKSDQAVASLKFGSKLSQFRFRHFQKVRVKNSYSTIKNLYKSSFKGKASSTILGSLSLET